MSRSFLTSFILIVATIWCGSAHAQKETLYRTLQQRENLAWDAALKIWHWAEPGYQEHKSSALLAEMLEREGFHVERGVAEIPTAFTATYGQGRPVIAILGEYDALPGLSQQAVPHRQPREDAFYGHACGHHLFGVASAEAAIAVAQAIKDGHLRGTVRFYGCPAEEGGSAKVFIVRAGLFKDCDLALHWHPSSQNSAGDKSSLARIAVKFRFHGKSAHAAGAPDQGRSALDAVEITNHAAQLLREHTPDLTRIHHVITAGGNAPNVVPDFAEVWYYVRHPKAEVVRKIYQRLLLCAQAGALATETRLEIRNEGGTYELLPNDALSQVALANLQSLNKLRYTADEVEFATRIQATMEKPEPLDSIERVTNVSGTTGRGSTDVGDVSWVVPTTGFTTACWAPGTPGHSWQAVAAGGTTLGRKGMHLAARVLAAIAWDAMQNPRLVSEAQAEHARRLGKTKYEPLIDKDQRPPLDYRNPPKGPQKLSTE
jgi:aminobenzoyl-glutamate utilization protein B